MSQNRRNSVGAGLGLGLRLGLRDRDRFVTGSGVFLPSSIANLEFWFDASDSGTITEVGGEVSQWDDKSVNGRDLVQASAPLQPNTSTFGGNPTIFFDGSNIMQNLSISFSMSPETTVFCVATSTTNNSNKRLYSLDITAGNLNRSAVTPTSTSLRCEQKGSTSISMTLVNTGNNGVTFGLVDRTDESGGSDAETISGETASDATGSSFNTPCTSIHIGNRASETTGWNGHINEIGFYSARVSDSERSQLFDYLATKWGL